MQNFARLTGFAAFLVMFGSPCLAQEQSPLAEVDLGIGVARRNAAEMDIGRLAQRRLGALPPEAVANLADDIGRSGRRLAAARDALKRQPITSGAMNERIVGLDKAANFSKETQGYILGQYGQDGAPPSQAKPVDYRPEYVLSKLKPTFAVCGGRVWSPPGFTWQRMIDKVSPGIQDAALSVGLFSLYRQAGGPSAPSPRDVIVPAAGTAVAVSTDLVLTNHHVVANMVEDPGLPPDQWKLNSAKLRVLVGFPVETGACPKSADTNYFEVTEVAFVGRGQQLEEDFAVLRVKSLSGQTLKPVTIPTEASYSGDLFVGVIGYPDRPNPIDYLRPTGSGLFRDVDELEAFFELPNGKSPKYRIERFGFGQLVDLRDPLKRVVGHDAPTDNSSSGSLVVSLETGLPIAIHAGGNLGAGINAGVNIAYRTDYIMQRLAAQGLIEPKVALAGK